MTHKPPVEMGHPIVPLTLQCGCRRGFVLCDEAQSLWAAVGIAYGRRDFDEYDRRLNAYNDHIGIAR